MQKYLIELVKYTEEGVPTNEYSSDYADTPQGLADKVAKWNKMRYSIQNEDGSVASGNKMYKVTPKQATYSAIEDFDNFVAVNGVEYHK